MNFTLFFGAGILLAWPDVWSSDRFLLPYVPIFIIYLFSTLFWLKTKLKAKYFVPIFTGILIFLNLISLTSHIKRQIGDNLAFIKGNKYAGYPMDWRRYFEMIEWVDKNIPDDKIIMARKPEFVYLMSEHKSFCYPFTTDNEEVKAAVQKADYIIFDNFQWTGTTHRYLLPVLQKIPDKFKVIYKTRGPEFFLLEVLK